MDEENKMPENEELNENEVVNTEEVAEEEFEDENSIILSDEDGNDVRFEFLDLIDDGGEQYVVLIPEDEVEGVGDGEVVILKIEPGQNEEEENYIGVDDDETLQRIFGIFKEKNKDTFNFEQ